MNDKVKAHMALVDTPCIDHGKRGNNEGRNAYASVRHCGKTELMHRVAYCKAHGVDIKSIKGLVVRHQCDNPRCINPAHLLLGTTADNNRDKAIRGRSANLTLRTLTMDEVREIRRTYVPGGTAPGQWSPNGQHALARKYGVNQGIIYRIVHNLNYKEQPNG